MASNSAVLLFNIEQEVERHRRLARNEIGKLGRLRRRTFGPTRRDRERQVADDELRLSIQRLVAEYRGTFLTAQVVSTAQKLAVNLPVEAGVPRFWLSDGSRIFSMTDQILALIPDSSKAQELCGVTSSDIRDQLRRKAADQRRISNSIRFETVVAGQLRLTRPTHRMQDTFLTWEIAGVTGWIQRINVDDIWRGLGLAQKMLQFLIAQNPEVTTWLTTVQYADGVRLFGHMKTIYPDFGWEQGNLRSPID